MKVSPGLTKTGVIIIEGHVQGLSNTRSFGEAGIPVYVIDKTNCIARYSRYCKKFFYCPDFLSDDFSQFLIDLAQKENLDGWILMPSNDHAVYNISKNKEILEQYYKHIVPDEKILENIYDKAKLLDIATHLNLTIPQTQFFLSPQDPVMTGLKFPLITKGRNGLSFFKTLGRKVFLSESDTELREQLKKISEKYPIEKTFTQELIPFDGNNKTISFTAFCINGEIQSHWMGEKVREHPIRFGTATFAKSILCPQLSEPSREILNHLKYTGVCEIEYLLDPRDGKYKLIEINPRTWLWVGLAKSCGVDYALMIYNFLNGIATNYPTEYQVGVNWVNYVTDLPFSLIAIFRRKLNVNQFFSSFKGKTMNAIFSWQDIKPGIFFLIMLFYIAIKRR